MKRILRGHHLLCTHGFKGMGYSPEFVHKMAEIVEDIRNDDMDFPIQVVQTFDDACGACPHKGKSACEKSEDSNNHVLTLDSRVIHHLGLKPGEVYMKSELINTTAQKVKPEDLDHLCEGCSWLEYGVCKDGIEALRKKELA
ncbi:MULTISPECIES: DUF1284 domain-containing protein [Bacillaceae]|uniref:DUF1284 domain-containing protein n=1 Tax=Bacillaceae TaxID=186817 RepID=UPI001C56D14B|nr:DUF1284 domain-containing protein [Rossellomorea sp. YZS02]MBW3112834.1 DUF1284 domain-containing protein [Bacillus sp. MCCB 382]MDX8342814.1 DUF1284 domain-containing protein [Rossellomorea sp. YZS02]